MGCLFGMWLYTVKYKQSILLSSESESAVALASDECLDVTAMIVNIKFIIYIACLLDFSFLLSSLDVILMPLECDPKNFEQS